MKTGITLATALGAVLFVFNPLQATASMVGHHYGHRAHAATQWWTAEYTSGDARHYGMDEYRHESPISDYMPDEGSKDEGKADLLPISDVVYQDVSFIEHKRVYTESFLIDTAGTYQVSLTDFEFPKPLLALGLNITSATESFGSLMETGAFTFDADPGKYFVSFFGKAKHLGQYGIEIGLVNTSAVPVPGAALLFGSGLLGLAGAARRRAA